jgi:uncharacterized protein (DUF1501 family)
MDRRQFLKLLGLLGTSAIATLGTHTWIARTSAQTANPKRLIVIFLRGAVDGLNVVVPYGEPDYYEARPLIAIPQPGEDKGALDLDGFFGLHPALSSLLPLWQQKNLAFIHSCGSTDPTRSHFDAQYYMETGVPGDKKISEGWMNRLLAALPGQTPVEAVSVGQAVPRALVGPESVANIALGRNSARQLPIDRENIQTAFDQLYTSQDPISLAYQEGRTAREQLLEDLEAEMDAASQGAPLPNGFAGEAQQLASLIVRDPTIQLAFMDLGGWDTHVNQGGSKGQLANRLKPLGEGLAALVKRLDRVYEDTTIVVMSEFGRTVKENGNGGTDHGHGNVLWLLGGAVRGGQVYGQWPGLSESELYEGRDLAITTDFRDVMSAVLTNQLQVKPNQVDQVFVGYRPSQQLNLFLA